MILEARTLQTKILENLKVQVATLKKPPVLCVFLVGNDPASEIYVRNKQIAAEKVGIIGKTIILEDSISEEALKETVLQTAKNPEITGIIVQLPLPNHINAEKIIACIPSEKDVDGFSHENMGKMLSGEFQNGKSLISCTPKGILRLLEHYNISLVGKHIVLVGSGKTVGRPLAALLLHSGATLTVCNKHTSNLSEHTKQADIIIVAVGIPHTITADMVQENAVVIDVGINRKDGKICGDADFENIIKRASCSPVPGGIGPMTIAMLLENTMEAAFLQNERY